MHWNLYNCSLWSVYLYRQTAIMNLADILKDIGNEGLFQIIALLTLAMPKLPMQWSMTVMSYAAYEPEWCCVPQDVQVDKNCAVQFLSFTPNGTRPSYKSTYGNCDLNSTVCSRNVFLASDDASTAVTEVRGCCPCCFKLFVCSV